MAKKVTEIKNNTAYEDEYIGRGESKWYKVRFDEPGKANFYISPDYRKANIDLFVYKGMDPTSEKLGESTNGAGKDDIIFNLPVGSNVDYYIYVLNNSRYATEFFLKVRNDPYEGETKAAEIAKSMPLTKAFNLEENIPSDLSTDHALARKNLMMGPIKIDFSAGICSNPSDRKYSLNCDMTEPFLINGATYSFASEKVTNLGDLGKAIERFLNRRGYEDITFSMGNVNLYADGTFTVSAFQLQDSHALGDGKYVYTRLDFSRDIDFNNFTGFLEFCEASHENDKEYVRAVVFGVAIALAALLIPAETAGVLVSIALVELCKKVVSTSTHYLDFGVVL